MARTGKRWKQWVQRALIVVFVLDLALIVVRWRIAVVASQAQLALTLQHLRADTARLDANLGEAEAIRRRLPQVKRDCDNFFVQQLLSAREGYGALVADLGNIARQSGLRASGVRFQQKELANRGVTEVQASATIEGDYPGLIRFINGLERSKNFYLLDNLALASSAGGRIKLNIELRTYFRSS